MNEEINNLLLDELFEAHGIFDNIISELKENNADYQYATVVKLEECSYNISYNAITKMQEALEKYNYLMTENEEFFTEEKKIIFKYLMLYIVSIIMIRVFAKNISMVKLNEIWYALVGLVFGSVNAAIINKNINSHRYESKDNRDLMYDIHALKEEYDRNFEIARHEINYMFSLNRNLENDIDDEKVLVKKMQ